MIVSNDHILHLNTILDMVNHAQREAIKGDITQMIRLAHSAGHMLMALPKKVL